MNICTRIIVDCLLDVLKYFFLKIVFNTIDYLSHPIIYSVALGGLEERCYNCMYSTIGLEFSRHSNIMITSPIASIDTFFCTSSSKLSIFVVVSSINAYVP